MTEGLALSLCPGCCGASRSAGRQLCLLITAENIRSLGEAREGERDRERERERGGGLYSTLHSFFSHYLFSLEKQHALSTATAMYVCMCVFNYQPGKISEGVEETVVRIIWSHSEGENREGEIWR